MRKIKLKETSPNHFKKNQLQYNFSCPYAPISMITIKYLCALADSGFFKNFLYQGGVKSTVSWVFEDLKFKISEGYDQNWCFPDSAQLAVSV